VETADFQINEINKVVGRKLKKARELCDLTQAQVAEYLDVKREVVSYYESGTRPISLSKLTALSDLYGYNIGYFLNEETEEEPVSLPFRATGIKTEDLEIIARVKRFTNNLHFLNSLLEEKGLLP
jgi:transcriptional regulator with XRE-family HTH domain